MALMEMLIVDKGKISNDKRVDVIIYERQTKTNLKTEWNEIVDRILLSQNIFLSEYTLKKILNYTAYLRNKSM
jgi:hypothetical protein